MNTPEVIMHPLEPHWSASVGNRKIHVVAFKLAVCVVVTVALCLVHIAVIPFSLFARD